MQNTSGEQTSQGQLHALFAAYLGWTLDAFDFFIMVFVLREVAASFQVPVGDVATAITLTLACRAVGAIIFGRLADRFGRRPVLMLNIVCYALLEFCSGLAPTLTAFLILRALFGVAMGGEWGVASSLVMESVPEKWRGLASGVLQAGYPSGYLLASLLYLALPWLGWRGMFMVGILPAVLAFYVRRSVQESPAWQSFSAEDRKVGIWQVLRRSAGFASFAVVLMMALNFFAHGSQDLYPSEFLGAQHKLSTDMISAIMIVANIGGLIGGIAFGMLSQRIGRKWAMTLAVLLALPVLPFWASASTPLMLGFTAFLMLVCVQGAWGIVPAYLNELSPPSVRATFPGFVYQAGNFLAAANANIQIWIAGHFANNYGLTMALTAGVMAILVALLVASGPEPKGARMAAKPRGTAPKNDGTGILTASVL
ncbi:MFS transporter [Bradyrhizobium symbiodeficiens]|uniref:MFS transporter n=1 Tax=Bradyrhizobium symbiodeficiens TaxID=1404367 RepID=A0A6G9A0H9_9BRAD|nr:MFS transporter [Bradyrhizobium symbiodeficiens]QIP05805.1 MFS transporter [Bradyrhizobium symbiodeficiens]